MFDMKNIPNTENNELELNITKEASQSQKHKYIREGDGINM